MDGSISNFKGIWCIYLYFISYRNTCMQTVKILIIRRALRRLISKSVRSGPALFAYDHFYRTLCTSGLSNVPEILQFHDCNVTLYTAQKILCYFFVPLKEALSKEVAKEGNIRSPEYKHLFILFFFFSFNTTKCLGSCKKDRYGRET